MNISALTPQLRFFAIVPRTFGAVLQISIFATPLLCFSFFGDLGLTSLNLNPSRTTSFEGSKENVEMIDMAG